MCLHKIIYTLSYYESGAPEVFSYYLNGSFHGKRFNFSPDGQLQIIRYYDYDVLTGYSYLSQTGDTLPMISLPNESGKIIAYFANGNKSFEAEVKYGEYINDYNLYYATGQRYRYNQNVDGDYHGVFQLYYPDGTLQYEAQYLKGDLEGSVKKYYPNGKIKQIAHYKLGKAHGLSEKYDENGKLVEKITYYDDEATAYEKF